jgi:Tfp pilus assembly protein PilP
MKLAKTSASLLAVLALMIGSGARAQDKSAAKPPAKPATTAQAAPNPAPAKSAPAAKPTTAKPAVQTKTSQGSASAKPATAKPKAAKAPKIAKPAEAAAAKPSETASAANAAPEEKKIEMEGKRDPFVPLLNTEKSTLHLPPGKAGLVISTVHVDGAVRSQGGMIAVVSNPEQRVYFVREGDRLYDGSVETIGMDGVTFRETTKDAFGKPVERVVTKRIYATAGEQQ